MEIIQPDVKSMLFDDTLKFYNILLRDIDNASDYVYMEFYKFGNDAIGRRFRDTLTRKARQGIKIRLLLDSWGTSLPESFFSDLIKYGGEVRFFEKIRFNLDFFTRSHRRNHRKIVVIDDKISYLGSSNITDYNMVWRELILRLEGKISLTFKGIFLQMFDIYNTYMIFKSIHVEPVYAEGFEIIRDVPSIRKQTVKKKYSRLIKSAKKKIVIETPYFLPGFLVRKAMIDAVKRGVKVMVLLPRQSDVRLVDILRNKYLGPLHEKGVQFHFFAPQNLHAKLLVVDDDTFCVGSPNFDFRSFRFQHEIILCGRDRRILNKLREHIRGTLAECEPFNYARWKTRPAIEKFFEWLIVPFRHLL
jgi:cardiolipin synthase